MQSLARYVFQSGVSEYRLELLSSCWFLVDNLLCPGDHISWHKPLVGSESRIQHMLLTEDPQLNVIDNDLGMCAFVQVMLVYNRDRILTVSCIIIRCDQVVGITADELESAQKWNGPGILTLLKSRPE